MAAELKKIDCTVTSVNCVSALTELLEAAKSGKMLGFAIVWNDNRDNTHTEYCNDSNRTGLRDLVAGASLLLHRLTSRWND